MESMSRACCIPELRAVVDSRLHLLAAWGIFLSHLDRLRSWREGCLARDVSASSDGSGGSWHDMGCWGRRSFAQIDAIVSDREVVLVWSSVADWLPPPAPPSASLASLSSSRATAHHCLCCPLASCSPTLNLQHSLVTLFVKSSSRQAHPSTTPLVQMINLWCRREGRGHPISYQVATSAGLAFMTEKTVAGEV